MAENECKVGIVSLHMIMAPAVGLYGVQDEIEEELNGNGYAAKEVMLYDEVNTPPSIFDMISYENARNDLVAKYDDSRAFGNIINAVRELKKKGCKRVVLAGEGLGAIIALNFVEDHPEIEIAGVAGWYPHIDYPEVVTKAGKKPPDYEHLKVPTILFFGREDKIVGDIAKIESFDEQNPNLVVHVLDSISHWDDGHAFFTPTANGLMPNPYYKKSAADQSWKYFVGWLEGFKQ